MLRSVLGGMLVPMLFALSFALPWASPSAYAQKIAIPAFGGSHAKSGGNILQVEGVKGNVTKIDYVFNYRKQKIGFLGQAYFPVLHDRISYSAALDRLSLTTGIYTLATLEGQRNEAPGNSWNFDINSVKNEALRRAIDEFIFAVGKQAGVAKSGRVINILQLPEETLAAQVTQLKNAAL